MLLICNGRLFARDEENTYIENGAVAVEGERIVEIGQSKLLTEKYPDAERIDAAGGLILPGLVNAHDHIYSAFARGIAIKGYSPKSFSDILDGMWWTIDRNLSLHETKMSAMATYLDCIRCGVTTIFDHHASYGAVRGSLFEIAVAAEELGVRTCLCYEVSDRDGEDKCREAIAENVDFINTCRADNSDMKQGMMGLHASFTLSDKTLRLARESTPANTGFHIHVAEGMTDVYDSLKKYNKRVVNRLFDNGILGEKTITGHCIHIGGDEMDILKATGTMVVHNPESNMGNAVGCPPTLELMRRGILTGLGTDGYTQDMFESAKVANILHKHHLCDPTVSWAEVPQMLYHNNPLIGMRYFDTPIGMLKNGYAADIIVVEYDPPTPLDENNLNGHLLFGVMGHDVSMTMINGKVKMKNKQLVGIDGAQVMAHCREAAAALWKRINQE